MSRLCDLGEGRFAHASGALWIEAARTAVIADVHLGYGWAQRRRGELGPVDDTESQPRLRALVGELNPARVVFLGDLVHAPKPASQERDAIEATLQDLAQSASLVLVRGNHDRAFARDFGNLGVQVVERWTHNGLTALHGDRLDRLAMPDGHLVLGHLHPVLKLKDAAGARQTLRLFLVAKRITVLPAFSPYSGGFDVGRGIPANLQALLLNETVHGVALSGKNAMRIGPVGLRPKTG